MIKEKYLPLGTVVLLKNAKKRLVIIGYAGVSPETGKKVFDYMGCLYPEGMLSSDKNLLFDHEQIDKIIFEGYTDEEDKAFKNKLTSIIEKSDNQNNLKSDELELPIMNKKDNLETESDIEILPV